MVFSSLAFLFAFFPIILLAYLITPRKLRNLLLFMASLLFYYSGGRQHMKLLLLVIAVSYLVAMLIGSLKNCKMKSICMGVSVAFLVCLLCYYKYHNFFYENLIIFGGSSVSYKEVILPIGISFFVFQAISYIVDAYRGESVIKNPIDMGMYISFFPQLIAGPIVRYKDIANSVSTKNRKIDSERLAEGIWRFSVGLCKKVLLANNLGGLADLIYNADNTSALSVCYVWLGSLAYSLQIYYDFSGYSDMAIGLGKVFGFDYLENFNYPYCAKSIRDFWTRWHMSLSGWFRDYVYIPLGGSRCSTGRCLFNLLVVWCITGFWHGASWNFLLWGLGYGILLVFEKYFIKPEHFKRKTASVLYRVTTLIFINLLWVIFRTETLPECREYFSSMFGMHSNAFIDQAFIFQLRNYALLLIAAIVFSIPIIPKLKEKMKNNIVYKIFSFVLLLSGFTISVLYLLMGGYNPFLYYIF